MGDHLVDGGAPVDGPVAGPALLRATVPLEAPTGLFLDTVSWGKGLVWVNGFNLGRHRSRACAPAPNVAAERGGPSRVSSADRLDS